MTPCSVESFKELKSTEEFKYFLGKGWQLFKLPGYTQTPECDYKAYYEFT